MAKAYKCDICGGFYTFKDDNDIICGTQNQLMQNQLILRRSHPSGNWYDMAEEFDICPDCAKTLREFIKKGGNHETAEKADQESEGIAGEKGVKLEGMDVGV